MFKNSFDNGFAKIQVVGVNTTGKNILGGLSALNCVLDKNLPNVNCTAVDRHDTANLDGCKATHKMRLLNAARRTNGI